MPDQAALALALIENIQREDLNPLEEAQGLQRLIDEFGLTHDAAAKAVGRSRSAVTNLLRLTTLAKPVQEYLLDGALEMGHARALLGAAGGAAGRRRGARRRTASCRCARPSASCTRLQNPAKRAGAATREPRDDADTARLENELAERLGAMVRIEPGRKGAGRVVIRYANARRARRHRRDARRAQLTTPRVATGAACGDDARAVRRSAELLQHRVRVGHLELARRLRC